MSQRVIGHVDADCFYVSAERVRYPHLKGQPVGVLGNQGACVIAKSYELKACGVKTGQPIWEVVPLCPETIFVKRDFRWYEVLSKKMLGILQSVSPEVEYYSIDEMFFDAGQLPAVFSVPLVEAAIALQQRVLQEVGIPVSIGISLTRSIAKLASDARKPFGCTVLLERDEIEKFLEAEPVSELCGIGGKSAQKLAEFGINTCLDLAKANRGFVQKLLTVKGEALWYELHGEPVIPILTKRPENKRIGRGGSLGESTRDRARLAAWVVRNVERLVEELDYHKVHLSALTMSLEYKGDGWGKRVKFPEPTSAFAMLVRAGLAVLRVWPGDQDVSGMHLEADRLVKRERMQRLLFDPPVNEQAERADAVKREINEKLGRFTLRSGMTLPLEELYRDEACDFDICDVHGKICF